MLCGVFAGYNNADLCQKVNYTSAL